MFCQHCGAQIDDNAVVCVKCGCAVNGANQKQNSINNEWLVVTLLCFFLGGLGIHRFYTGIVKRLGSEASSDGDDKKCVVWDGKLTSCFGF